MSNENEVKNEVVETTEQKKTQKKTFTVIKEIISAIIGAIISFAVTFGVITSDQEVEIKSRMNNINTSATEVVELIKKGDIVNALAKANKIVEDTNAVKNIAKSGVEKTKEKAQKTKEIVEKASTDIKKATEKK